jgi:hypothetical protein
MSMPENLAEEIERARKSECREIRNSRVALLTHLLEQQLQRSVVEYSSSFQSVVPEYFDHGYRRVPNV